MTSETLWLDDDTFLAQFENQTLDPVHFKHIGHVRITWIYLSKYELDVAKQKVCSGVKTYAESLDVYDKFNLTVTDALVKIICKRLDTAKDKSWHGFLNENQDLLDNAMGILLEHFSTETLLSETARNNIVTPDIKPF